jgi:glyoxylase-like metal-dependent hydrolase (beta-lactamase superfamily II)
MSRSMVSTDPTTTTPVFYGDPGEVAPNVFMHPAFVNTYALRTPDGLVVIDPGFTHSTGAVRDAIRAWCADPVRAGVYTHGHADHAFGMRAFLEAGERPEIIAQENCVARFHRYRAMNGLNGRINMRQFGLPMPVFPKRFDWPTLLVRDVLAQRFGDLDVEYHAARGETDDHLWVWVPKHRYLFTGDLIIWRRQTVGTRRRCSAIPRTGPPCWRRWPASSPSGCFPATGPRCTAARPCGSC